MIDKRFIICSSMRIFIFCSFLFITSCKELIENSVWPWNKIISLYESPKIDLYKIRSVALLPMIPDDTTDAGTFYSTNHFINSLEREYPDVKFVVSKIDTAISFDSLAVSKIIDSIEKRRKLDLKSFYDSELGYDVMKDSADAIIIGEVDSCSKKNGSFISHFLSRKTRIISCSFVYYLISLKDGRVLWKAQVLGEDGFLYESAEELYPPLHYAISNGIDLIVNKIPL